MLDTSEQYARAMLSEYVRDVSAAIGGQLEAIVLTGSLATGSYIPGPGDIDQITIVRDSAPDSVVAEVQQIRQSLLERHARAINMADVVYRRSELDRPWQTVYDLRPETRHQVTVPEELLRIADHGQMVYGDSDILHSLETPTIQEMTEYHRRWRLWNNEIKQQRQDIADNAHRPTVRLAVQSILSKALWHYYYITKGRTCFNKNTIAGKIKNIARTYAFQETLDAATKIRVSGNFDLPEATARIVLSGYTALFEWVGSHEVDEVPTR